MKKVIIASLILLLAILPIVALRIVYPVRYKKEIAAACDRNGVDRVLVASIIFCESRYKKNAVSNRGAKGLMQLMPSTAMSFYGGEDFDESVLFDPQTNIEIGTKYLKYLFEKYDDEIVVLSCYNAGESVVRTWLSEGELEIENIPFKETKNYAQKVLKMKNYYKKFF